MKGESVITEDKDEQSLRIWANQLKKVITNGLINLIYCRWWNKPNEISHLKK